MTYCMLQRTVTRFVLLSCLIFSAKVFGVGPKVTVYSGCLEHKSLAKHQLAEIHFIGAIRPGASTPTYSAILVLHHGAIGGPEYVALTYDTVLMNNETHEIF